MATKNRLPNDEILESYFHSRRFKKILRLLRFNKLDKDVEYVRKIMRLVVFDGGWAPDEFLQDLLEPLMQDERNLETDPVTGNTYCTILVEDQGKWKGVPYFHMNCHRVSLPYWQSCPRRFWLYQQNPGWLYVESPDSNMTPIQLLLQNNKSGRDFQFFWNIILQGDKSEILWQPNSRGRTNLHIWCKDGSPNPIDFAQVAEALMPPFLQRDAYLSLRDVEDRTALDHFLLSSQGTPRHKHIHMLLPQNTQLRKEILLHPDKSCNMETPLHTLLRKNLDALPKDVEALVTWDDGTCRSGDGADEEDHHSNNNPLLLQTNSQGLTPLHVFCSNTAFRGKYGPVPFVMKVLDLLLPSDTKCRHQLLTSHDTSIADGNTLLHLWVRNGVTTAPEVLTRFIPQGHDNEETRRILLETCNNEQRRPVDIALELQPPMTAAALRMLIPTSFHFPLECFTTTRNQQGDIPLKRVLERNLFRSYEDNDTSYVPELEMVHLLWPKTPTRSDENLRSDKLERTEVDLDGRRSEIFHELEFHHPVPVNHPRFSGFQGLWNCGGWTPTLEFFVRERYKALEGNPSSFTTLHAVTSLEYLPIECKIFIWQTVEPNQFLVPDHRGRLALHIAMQSNWNKAFHSLWDTWNKRRVDFEPHEQRAQLLHVDDSGRLPLHYLLRLCRHTTSSVPAQIGKDMIDLEPSLQLMADRPTGLLPVFLLATTMEPPSHVLEQSLVQHTAMTTTTTPASLASSFVSEAPARLCFFGEHSDYLGLPVISCAAPLYCRIQVALLEQPSSSSSSDVTFTLRVPQLNQVYVYSLDNLPPRQTNLEEATPDFALAALHEALDKGWTFSHSIDCVSTTEFPMQAGISSSSAFCVAWCHVLQYLASTGEQKSNSTNHLHHSPSSSFESAITLAQLAHQAEVTHFGAPGGTMDHVTSAVGGMLRIGPGLWDVESLPLPSSGGSCWILADSGQPKDTFRHLHRCKHARLALFEKLGKTWDTKPDDIVLSQDEQALWKTTLINRSTEEAAFQHWMSSKSTSSSYEVAKLMQQHHNALRDGLHLSTTRLEVLGTAARSAGAWAFKVVGSGGGGCGVAWSPDHRAADVAKAMEAAGAPRTWIIAEPAPGARLVFPDEEEAKAKVTETDPSSRLSREPEAPEDENGVVDSSSSTIDNVDLGILYEYLRHSPQALANQRVTRD